MGGAGRADPVDARQFCHGSKRSLPAERDDLLRPVRPDIADSLQRISVNGVDVDAICLRQSRNGRQTWRWFGQAGCRFGACP